MFFDTGVNHPRPIMGEHVWGATEWLSLSVPIEERHLTKLGNFPWSEEILRGPCPFNPGKEIRETHFAFLGVEYRAGQMLTLMRLKELHPNDAQPRFRPENVWYEGEPFANWQTANLRWFLMPIEGIPLKTGLPATYKQAFALAETMKDLFYFRRTEIYPNRRAWAICSDRTLSDYRVAVGCFDERGLSFAEIASGNRLVRKHLWDGYKPCRMVIAATRARGR